MTSSMFSIFSNSLSHCYAFSTVSSTVGTAVSLAVGSLLSEASLLEQEEINR